MRRYLWALLAPLLLALALVLVLNLLLGDRSLGNEQVARTASAWQQATRGVTYAPPIGNARPFKVLRLADRLPEINAAVLGSSALMGITQSLLPPELRMYNLTVTGNSTAAIAGEALHIERHYADRVRWVLAGLDWSVRDEILELLVELSQERVVLVVTHEPELFTGLIPAPQCWSLQRGVLQPEIGRAHV